MKQTMCRLYCTWSIANKKVSSNVVLMVVMSYDYVNYVDYAYASLFKFFNKFVFLINLFIVYFAD